MGSGLGSGGDGVLCGVLCVRGFFSLSFVCMFMSVFVCVSVIMCVHFKQQAILTES